MQKIKDETADIVAKMKDVSASSDESFKNLTELENVLDEFKTKETDAVETEALAEVPDTEAPADAEFTLQE